MCMLSATGLGRSLVPRLLTHDVQSLSAASMYMSRCQPSSASQLRIVRPDSWQSVNHSTLGARPNPGDAKLNARGRRIQRPRQWRQRLQLISDSPSLEERGWLFLPTCMRRQAPAAPQTADCCGSAAVFSVPVGAPRRLMRIRPSQVLCHGDKAGGWAPLTADDRRRCS